MYDNPMWHVSMPEMLEGESYIDACVRTTPAKVRALCGITLRIVGKRMKDENDESIKVLRKYYNFIEAMSDEEYELFKNLYDVRAKDYTGDKQ